MQFYKYHALGNDYIVLDPKDYPSWEQPSGDQIRAICHRQYGLGSDGILWGPLPSESCDFGLRIFNPDGSEAEKSGNGLRIFSRYLWDHKLASDPDFKIETPGGPVSASIHEKDLSVTVEMGRVSFESADIPVSGPPREVLNETISSLDREFTYSAATIGNPHCIVPMEEISSELACRYGPAMETHSNFPHRTNVQFLHVIDRSNIGIEIWERGAGYTLASGSSASASAAVARKLDLVDSHLTVHMPGGKLAITISPDYEIIMTGSVNQVAEGQLHPELFTPKG